MTALQNTPIALWPQGFKQIKPEEDIGEDSSKSVNLNLFCCTSCATRGKKKKLYFASLTFFFPTEKGGFTGM